MNFSVKFFITSFNDAKALLRFHYYKAIICFRIFCDEFFVIFGSRCFIALVWRRNAQMGTQNISLMCVRSCHPKCRAHPVRLQSPSST